MSAGPYDDVEGCMSESTKSMSQASQKWTDVAFRAIRWDGWRLVLPVFCFAAILYVATAARGIQWQDRGAFVMRVLENKPLNELGLALSHPLHFYISRLAVLSGIAAPPFAVTIVSALAGATAIGLLAASVLTLTGSKSAALFSAFSLMVANSFWQMATVAEVYSLTASLLALEIFAVTRYARTTDTRLLYLVFFANGLGISNHLQAGLTSPILMVWLVFLVFQGNARIKDAFVSIALMTVGASLYLYLILDDLMASGSLTQTLKSALFGHHFQDGVLNTDGITGLVFKGVAFTLLAFPHLLLPLAVAGMTRQAWAGIRRNVGWVLFAGLCIHATFALRYRVVDQYTFFMPMFLLLALFGGMGYHLVAKSYGQGRYIRGLAWLLLVMTPFLYLLVPGVARSMNILGDRGHNKPYRDDYVYLFAPWSVVERSAERIAREAVALAGEDGIIIYEDGMVAFALAYQARAESREQIRIQRAPAAEVLSDARGCTVVLVPRDRDNPETLPPRGEWQRLGDLYVLKK